MRTSESERESKDISTHERASERNRKSKHMETSESKEKQTNQNT